MLQRRITLPLLLSALALTWSLHSRAEKPVGAPPTSAAEKGWIANASSPLGGVCCDESDGFREGLFYPANNTANGHAHPEGVIFREWRAAAISPGDFEVNILGKWFIVPKGNVVKEANILGSAIAWVVFNTGYMNSTIFVRCFAPGNMI